MEHRVFERITATTGADVVRYTDDLPDGRGVAVLTVGSGLLMLSCDLLRSAEIPVCCGADIGPLRDDQRALVADWARCTDGHLVVAVNAWCSRSPAPSLYRALRARFSASSQLAALVARIRGVGEEELPAHVRCEFEDWLAAVARAVATARALRSVPRLAPGEAQARWEWLQQWVAEE